MSKSMSYRFGVCSAASRDTHAQVLANGRRARAEARKCPGGAGVGRNLRDQVRRRRRRRPRRAHRCEDAVVLMWGYATAAAGDVPPHDTPKDVVPQRLRACRRRCRRRRPCRPHPPCCGLRPRLARHVLSKVFTFECERAVTFEIVPTECRIRCGVK